MFIWAAAKFFVINMLQMINGELHSEETEQITTIEYIQNRYFLSSMTNVVSMLVIGSLIDNIGDHKFLAIVCDLFLSVLYTTNGSLIIINGKTNFLSK